MTKNSDEIVSFKLFNRVITIGTPHRIELVLLTFYAFFFAVMDILQNKVIDLGIDYQVILFWQTTAPALLLWEISLILMHVALMGLFLMSLRSTGTDKTLDVIVGVIAFFGIAILLAGVVNQIYSPTIYFLGYTLRSIDFYHLGIYAEIFAGLWWAFTK